MSWIDEIQNILQRYTGAATGAAMATSEVHDHFDQVTQVAPKSAVAEGLAEAFRSNETPPFDQMIGQLFGHSDGAQRAGLLNQLLAVAGPGILSQFGTQLPSSGQITPQQAAQVSPDVAQQIAAHVEQKSPSIVDQVSSFYAQHPGVVKALGGAALAIAMRKIARRES